MGEFRRTRQPQRRQLDHPLADYVPPQDIEAEQAVLGSMFASDVAFDAARTAVEADDFYREAHRTLFTVMVGLADKASPVDLITIQSELKLVDKLEAIGGVSYLVIIHELKFQSINVLWYAQKVKFHSNRRKAISAALQLIATSRTLETEKELDDAKAAIFNALEGVKEHQSPPVEQIGEISWEMYAEIADRQVRRNLGEVVVSGLRTRFWQLNRLIGGLQRSDVITIGARTSVGKSSLIMDQALFSAAQGLHVVIITYEMNRKALTRRALCSMADVEMIQFERENFTQEEWNRWYKANEDFDKMRLSIVFKPSLTPAGIAAKCRELSRKNGPIDLLIIDYLNVIPPDVKQFNQRSDNRNIEVGQTMKAIKRIACEHDCPVILACQLSRAVEQTDTKRAELHHLRDSGEIEADSDVVIFPFRPAKYADQNTVDPYAVQPVELDVKKSRNTKLGMVQVGFVPAFGIWSDWEEPIPNELVMQVDVPTRLPYAQDRDETEVGY